MQERKWHEIQKTMVTEYYLKGEKKTGDANSLFFGNWDTLFPVVTVQRHSMTVFFKSKKKTWQWRIFYYCNCYFYLGLNLKTQATDNSENAEF